MKAISAFRTQIAELDCGDAEIDADACLMENDPLGCPNMMVWGEIGNNQRVGQVVFQNTGLGRDNGNTVHRYID